MTVLPNLTSDQPLRILGPDLSDRLRKATVAIQRLSSLGYRVIKQDLRLDTRRVPLLTVGNADGELRAKCSGLMLELVEGHRRVIASFGGCDVTWTETVQ